MLEIVKKLCYNKGNKKRFPTAAAEKGLQMAKLTEKFDALKSNYTDPRTRRYLTPKRIVLTRGDVVGAENLLEEKSNQITLVVGKNCTLRNHEGQPNAGILVDFGIEFPGSARLQIWATSGRNNRADIRVRFGESVMEALTPIGEQGTTNDHAIRDMEMNVGFYSACETNETGYRFLYIELLEPNGTLTFKQIQGVMHYRDLDYKGSFECSDEKLTKIWNTAAYTAHVNMQEYLWDGIKRDRLIWIGDMHTEVNTIMTCFDKQDVVPKSLDVVRDETPAGGSMNGISSYCVWWLLIQYDWYRQYGDLAYLKEQREYMIKLLDTFADEVDENGVEKMQDGRFLDWPNNANPPAIHAGLQGLLKMMLERGAELLTVLGEKKVAEKCLRSAELLKKHVPDCNGSKQAAAALALSGLADAKEMNDKVIAPGGGHGYSTFFGYYILAAKAMAGDMNGALDGMKEYWGGMLDVGATTFWEDFDLNWLENCGRIDEVVPEGKIDIHGAYGNYCYVKFRHSLAHGWSSGPCPFMTNYVLGIKPLAPGKFEVKPDLGWLEWAKGTYPTTKGVMEVSVRKLADGSYETKINAPEGVEIVR